MIVQVKPPMPLETPKGKAVAHFLIDYGVEYNLMWVCFIDATGECWTFQNPEVRAQKNITLGRDVKMFCTACYHHHLIAVSCPFCDCKELKGESRDS